MFSKASRYMAFSCTDLDNARFWLGSKKVLDKQIYVVKTLHCMFLYDLAFALSSNSSCTNFELHEFFHSSKKRASQGFTVIIFFQIIQKKVQPIVIRPSQRYMILLYMVLVCLQRIQHVLRPFKGNFAAIQALAKVIYQVL